MSMQLSDDGLIDESQMRMTGQSSVVHDSIPHDVDVPEAIDPVEIPTYHNQSQSEQAPSPDERQLEMEQELIEGEMEYRVTKDRYVG